MANEEKWILPREDNPKSKSEVNEEKGKYFCQRCKGWGYINNSDPGFVGPEPWIGMPQLCPNCSGSGITDWVRNAMGIPTNEV